MVDKIMASRVVKKEVGVSQSLCFVKCVFLISSLDLILFHSANDSPVCKLYYTLPVTSWDQILSGESL